MYKKLKHACGHHPSGITRVDVPTDPSTPYKQCKDWLTIDTPKEIEDKLRAHNQQHFGQANGTFPTIPPFSEWVDWGASSHVSDLILEGDFHPTELTDLQQLLITHMQKWTTLDHIHPEFTISE